MSRHQSTFPRLRFWLRLHFSLPQLEGKLGRMLLSHILMKNKGEPTRRSPLKGNCPACADLCAPTAGTRQTGNIDGYE